MEHIYSFLGWMWQNSLSLLTLPFNPNHPFCVIYLLSAFGIATAIYCMTAKKQGKKFVDFIIPPGKYTHASSKVDYFIILIAHIFAVYSAFYFLTSITIGQVLSHTLNKFYIVPEFHSNLYWVIAFNVLYLMAYDFGKYITHFLQHKYWFIWEFHKIHHSAQVLTPFSVYRFHPIDRIMNILFIAFFTGVVLGLYSWLFNTPLSLYRVFSLHVGVFLFYLTTYNLRHSYIWLPFPKWLSYILMSPAQHQIHHSIEKQHIGKNLGHIFTLWDWLFGTLFIPTKREYFSIGVGQKENTEYENIVKVYFLPFYKVGNRFYQKIFNRPTKPAQPDREP